MVYNIKVVRPTSRMLCIRVVAVPGYFGSTASTFGGTDVSLLVDVDILKTVVPGTGRYPARQFPTLSLRSAVSLK